MVSRRTVAAKQRSLQQPRPRRSFSFSWRVVLLTLALYGGLLACRWKHNRSNQCTHLITYDPSYGGWNNQLLALFVGLHLAQLLGRRLVVPPLIERGRILTELDWTDMLDIEPALHRQWIQSRSERARCGQQPATSTVAFDGRNISLRLHRDAACEEAITALRAASAHAGPRLLQIANTYGLVRCFTRHDKSFLRLWQHAQLRPTHVARHWLQQWQALETASVRPLVIVVHVRSSGFEARAHQRRPHEFPGRTLHAWMLAGNGSACMHPAQRSALCQICAIQRRDPDARPVHFYFMHDEHAESLKVLAHWKAFVEASDQCGAAGGRVYDFTQSVWAAYEGFDTLSLVTEMYLAIYGAHLFVGSTLSTLSSNVARWRSLARYPLAPSLSYTGDRYLSAIPHILGFH
ncbi:hypothetical protein F1559_000426 [Cyanidiococcus yangmingshanensis]|uniref:Uncharacterized protein n=1 Tax=Cyanidiococcus yangmingshanensis TaxID=2690220 RepID=A0A7J7IJH1_9RHOD|nr:hypothetical protein F1559_000426 [Cyanidiococcus yangmingshanensis]